MKIKLNVDVEEKIMSIGGWCCICAKEIEDGEGYYEPTTKNDFILTTCDNDELDMICKECAMDSQSD